MAGEKAQLVHADPPYGMGKEKDGVENDNLYAEKLDAFQMAWWRAFRPHVEDNGSAYIWGNAEDLWRLWYRGGLKDSERLTFRNEIAWNKYVGNVKPTVIEMMRSYCNYSERCLFFMLGEQGFNNNADNYWEGWEPIRAYFETEMNKCGGSKKWGEALGNQMGSHYFTRSQWIFPTEEAYKKLQSFAKGDAFKRDYDELKREFYATRAYFDNTHDNMTDVWEFHRVTGEDRHGHATPKPVTMICRAIKSSSAQGEVVVEPFLGSGTTIIAAEQLGRKCYAMEISPIYCDVSVNRWEDFTGKKAERLKGEAA
jgi:DNA modification methylase